MPNSDTTGESLFIWPLTKGEKKKKKEISEFSATNAILTTRPFTEMSHRACGADGACVTGKLLVASCRESSHIADALEQGAKQRLSQCRGKRGLGGPIYLFSGPTGSSPHEVSSNKRGGC